MEYGFGSGLCGWRGLSLGFINHVGTGGVLNMCLWCGVCVV